MKKKLERNAQGKLVIVEVNNHSPIITEENQPESLEKKMVPASKAKAPLTTPLPRKADLKNLPTKEELLDQMKKAGGKNLRTRQFAELITPIVKKSEDVVGHHLWDIAHSHIRQKARQLEKGGLIKIEKDPSIKRTSYIYTVL